MENTPNNKESAPQTTPKPSPDRNIVKMMVYELATEFAFMIALPILGFVYAGRWFDAKYHTKYFVIIGFFVALALSSYMVGSRINKIRKRLK